MRPPTIPGIQTIDELAQYYYGRTPEDIYKAAGGFTTQTPGAYNPIFGAMVWANFNLEANIWALIPKYAWTRSGWRIFSAKAGDIADKGGNDNNTSLGGSVEGAQIADAIRPDVEELFTKPKLVQYPFQVSQLMEQLNDVSADDLYGNLNQQRVYAADQNKENFNKMLSLDPRTLTGGSTAVSDAADTVSRLNLESLERIISSNAQFNAELAADSNLATDAYNPWSTTVQISRDVSTTFDSTVKSAGSDLETSDVLTDTLIVDTIQDLITAGGKQPTVFLGGNDTMAQVQHLYMNAYRITDPKAMQEAYSVGVNGVDTYNGTSVGLMISTVYGAPFIPSKDTTTGINAGDVGNLYMLNTTADKNTPNIPMLGIRVLQPTLYYEASQRQQGFPFINGAFNDRGIYATYADTVCTNFKAQGKIVNIQPTSS